MTKTETIVIDFSLIDADIERLIDHPTKKKRISDPTLRKIFDRINAEYFDNKVDASIEWMVRSDIWGIYYPETKAIYISKDFKTPRLGRLPSKIFLEYVVYHEMLHQVIPSKEDKLGRVYHHSRAFVKREKLYKYYKEAMAWEKQQKNLWIPKQFHGHMTPEYQATLKKWGIRGGRTRKRHFEGSSGKSRWTVLGINPQNTKYKIIAESKRTRRIKAFTLAQVFPHVT